MNDSRSRRRRRRGAASGFTIIELLISLVVIGILALIAIPGLLNALDRSKQTASAALLRAFGIALEAYSTDNHQVPSVSTVSELIEQLTPYSDTLRPRDDWKHDLAYATDGQSYSVECYGKDGVDGEDLTPDTRYLYALDIVYSDGQFSNGIY